MRGLYFNTFLFQWLIVAIGVTKWKSEAARFAGRPTKKPTKKPTMAAMTPQPTISPTYYQPTRRPTLFIYNNPKPSATKLPTNKPSLSLTLAPTIAPTVQPTSSPTEAPVTERPTKSPTVEPSTRPTDAPTEAPVTERPTKAPTEDPTSAPTEAPTEAPVTERPTKAPTEDPTSAPTETPTEAPVPATQSDPPVSEANTLPPTLLAIPTSPIDPYATSSNSVPSTQEELLQSAESRIRETITNNPYLAATYLRLGFHDCVPNGDAGGCDGCINLSNPNNFGLLPAIQALSGIAADLESPALGVSRADIWALAVLVGAEVSQSDITFLDNFQVGRKNCETVGTCDGGTTDCATNGPDQISDFPTGDFTTHQLISFMSEHFNFNSDQTVAIMGAHTMGLAFPENSGYEGQFGWVFNPLSLGTNFKNDVLFNVLCSYDM
jgi:hypothetical protein